MAELFQVHQAETARVIEFHLPDSMDPLEFDPLNESILSLLDGDAGAKWIVDLSRVSYMGSAMLGLMVNLRHRIKRAGGRLVLCGLSPRLLEIFRTCCMERLFTITANRPQALKLAAK